MKKFICMNCRYKFKSELNRIGHICPYCGEKRLKEEESAQEILDE